MFVRSGKPTAAAPGAADTCRAEATPSPNSTAAAQSATPSSSGSGSGQSTNARGAPTTSPPGYDADALYANPEITALASSVATTLSKALLHPLDTLKCRLQLLRTDMAPPPWAASASSPHHPPSRLRMRVRQLQHQYTGLWTPRHLYGGLPVKLVLYVPYQATYVSSYNFAQHTLQGSARDGVDAAGKRSSEYLWHTIVAAVFAELVSACLRVPMETMKMRIQSTAASGSLHAMRQMWAHGLASCARLAVPQTLMHDVPYSVIQWVVYETLRPWTQQWKAHMEAAEEPALPLGGLDAQPGAPAAPPRFLAQYGAELARTFLSGGFSGLLASALTVPIDNIRTRVVVAAAHNGSASVREVVRDTLHREGLHGFVRGGWLRVLWVTTNMACYFPLFEGMRSLLQRRRSAAAATPVE